MMNATVGILEHLGQSAAHRSPSEQGRIIREGSKVAILSFGTRLAESLKAAEELGSYGLSTTVADARFAKPLDVDLILRLARSHEVLITVEEGSVGGVASQVMQLLATAGVFDAGLKFRPMTLPDMLEALYEQQKQIPQGGWIGD